MRIVLADNHPQRGLLLRRAVLGEGLTCESGDVVPFEMLPVRLAEVEPHAVLVACDGPLEGCLETIRIARGATPASILAAGALGDAERVRQTMAAGAREYLDISQIRDELRGAIAKLESNHDESSRHGQVISIFSASGGVGASTTAINLAARLAARRPAEIVLVDLKPAPSDLAVLLDMTPARTVDHLCRNWERVDRQMMAACMVRHRSGMDILAQNSYSADGGIPVNYLHRHAARQIITLLRRMYAVTVLDLDHTLSDEQFEAMHLSNDVVLLVRPDVPGLRRARWALDVAAERGLRRERFRLVLCRRGQKGQLSSAQAEELLELPVFRSIPDDHGTANRAVNRGVVLAEISRLSRISRSFSTLAKSVQKRARSVAR